MTMTNGKPTIIAVTRRAAGRYLGGSLVFGVGSMMRGRGRGTVVVGEGLGCWY